MADELSNCSFYIPWSPSILTNIDSLHNSVQYFFDNGWIESTSLANELVNRTTEMKNHLIQEDSISSIKKMDKFIGRIVNLMCDSVYQPQSTINYWAGKYLYNICSYIKVKTIHSIETTSFASTIPSSLYVGKDSVTINIKGVGFYYDTELYVNGHVCYFRIKTDTTAILKVVAKYLTRAGKIKISGINQITDFTNPIYLKVKPIVTLISPGITFPGAGSFTLEVKGKGFTANSKVLWNDAQRTTTFVADSLLKASILAQDVSAAGTYKVNVLTGDSLDILSDSLLFKVVTRLPKSIHLLAEKLVDNNDGTFTAYYGYRNMNPETVYIPIGDKNYFSPGLADRGQVTTFYPGRQKYAFSVQMTAGEILNWNLNGRHIKVKTQCDTGVKRKN